MFSEFLESSSKMSVNTGEHARQAECIYKNEHYSVRDNGAVFRHSRKKKAIRKLDNQWTFGKVNNCGYLLIGSEVVHRIVALSFLGEPPTPDYIVDHKDTNRQNNRPENLRWLTRFENILKNPITIKKIVFLCGSIEAFLDNPSLLKRHENNDSNFRWMKTVTTEEASNSLKRLMNWAEEDIDTFSKRRGSINNWIFKERKKRERTCHC